MAGKSLGSHGIDIDPEMARNHQARTSLPAGSSCISNVSLPCTQPESRWNVFLEGCCIDKIIPFEETGSSGLGAVQGKGALLAPSLCHPHVHLDKAYLLAHPRYAHLQIEKGDFQEAMSLTGHAKAQFEIQDLLERGQRVIDESIAAGVTHMRAFVEVDAGVHMRCLEAGIALKERAAAKRTCDVQLCAFAQLPLFSASPEDDDGQVIRKLMKQSAADPSVDVVGSTPYVEADRQKMEANVAWMIDLSIEHNTHIDFHLDYNLDPQVVPMVWHVVQVLKEKQWKDRTTGKTIVLGHCTRLTLLDDTQWRRLTSEITEAELPVSFVGLPTSDLFMMRTQSDVRGTLNVPRLIKEYNINACIGINNIGNAFTPQGSCDPVSLAVQGVGVYQAGTKRDAELLFECVSTRAKAAIGIGSVACTTSLKLKAGDTANLVLFGGSSSSETAWHTRRSISDAVYLYDHCRDRRTFFEGSPT